MHNLTVANGIYRYFATRRLRVRFETTTNTFGRFRSSRGEAINFVDNDWCGECPIRPWPVHPRQMCNFRTCHWKGLKFPLSQYSNSILRQWHNAARPTLTSVLFWYELQTSWSLHCDCFSCFSTSVIIYSDSDEEVLTVLIVLQILSGIQKCLPVTRNKHVK